MKRCIWLLFMAIGLFAQASGVLAAGLIVVDDKYWLPAPPDHIPPWPRPPIVRPIPRFAPLETTSVDVNTRINDQVAVTTIEQEFYNPNPTRMEGSFLFPIPRQAHIDKVAMDIDGKPVEAELLSAEKARRIYEDIVRKLKDPALIEYAGQDLIKVRIFPIEPNSKKHVTLKYTQVLQADDGLVGYALPLTAEKYSAKPVKKVLIKVDLETKRPLKSLYSPSHTVEIKRHGNTRATATFERSDRSPDTDFALYFAAEKDEIGLNLLTHRLPGEDGYFLLLASPGLDVSDQRVVPKDVLFVLDTSGSMAGKKLDQAKKALLFCVENLNDNDHFDILRFSTEAEPLFDKLSSASQANRERATAFIKDLRPMGGTAIDDALKRALALREGPASNSERPFVIIFLTDGRPTVGNTDENQIVKNVKDRNPGRIRIFCFGIGTDVNTHLLDKITEETRAFSQYVLPEEDLEVKVSSFYSKIKEPVLADPTLKFSGDVRVTRFYPNPLPDIFKGSQLVLAGRYSGKSDSLVTLEGTVSGKTRKLTYETAFPETASNNEFIPRLWATRRVGYLLDEIRLHGENSELRDEITQLARKYGIVTPYTAYLIVEDESRRNVPVQYRSLQSFEKDTAAREQAAATWNSFQAERGGAGGVAGARQSQMLKMADAAAPAASGGISEFSRAYGLAPPTQGAVNAPQDSRSRLVQYTQQARFVAGKSFFQNNNQWIDTEVQSKTNATPVRLQFGSAEYFAFAAKHPKAGAWLALGQQVQFHLDGVKYEVYE